MALHQLGAVLFNLNLRLHKGDIDSVVRWKPATRENFDFIDFEPRPTLFAHPAYMDEDVYREGRADVVGYWAEDRILGGVAVFDRLGQVKGFNPPNIYFHSCRYGVTDRLYQLRDEQQQALLMFFLKEETPSLPPSACPLPVLGDNENRIRVTAWIPIAEHYICRDIWERKPADEETLWSVLKRPQNMIEHLSIRDEMLWFLAMRDKARQHQMRPRSTSPKEE